MTGSPLLFAMFMIRMSMIHKMETKGYTFGNTGNPINHRLFMADLKLHASCKKRW